MKVIQIGDESTDFEPKNEEESELVSMLFENLTKNFPDIPLADRAGAAMEQFVVFKRWAHKENLTTGETNEEINTYDSMHTMEKITSTVDSVDDGWN